MGQEVCFWRSAAVGHHLEKRRERELCSCEEAESPHRLCAGLMPLVCDFAPVMARLKTRPKVFTLAASHAEPGAFYSGSKA